MTIVSTGLFINVVLVDAGGNKSTMRLKPDPAAAGYANLEALGGAAGQARLTYVLNTLALVTNARVISYNIGESFAENDSLLQFGPAGSEVERLASIVGPINGAVGKYHTLKIPSPVDGIFVSDGAPGPNKNQVDPADADLQAWLSLFQATIADADPYSGDFFVSDGEKLADITASNVQGKQIHRGSRKG